MKKLAVMTLTVIGMILLSQCVVATDSNADSTDITSNDLYCSLDTSQCDISNQLFDFVEESFPNFFNALEMEPFQIGDFFGRFYQSTNIYLATEGEEVYVYGGVFGGLVNVGKISDFIQIEDFTLTTDWLDGKKLYNVYSDDNVWELGVFSFTKTHYSAYDYNNPNYKLTDKPYTITDEGYIIFYNHPDDENDYIKITETTDVYLEIIWRNNIEKLNSSDSGDEFFYFDLQTAIEFVDKKNLEASENTDTVTLSGIVTFLDSDDNQLPVPTDAGIRIRSDVDQSNNNWDSVFMMPINSDGSFSLTKKVYQNSYKDGHTFQVVVFRNHIEPEKMSWNCGEDTYAYVTDENHNPVPFNGWSNIIIRPSDYKDRSNEQCNN